MVNVIKKRKYNYLNIIIFLISVRNKTVIIIILNILK